MLESEIIKLTAAITRLADLMEQGTAPTETWDGPVVDPAPVPDVVTPDYAALRQKAQDLCLAAVRADRNNKPVIGERLLTCHKVKTITQLVDADLADFVAYLEGMNK